MTQTKWRLRFRFSKIEIRFGDEWPHLPASACPSAWKASLSVEVGRGGRAYTEPFKITWRVTLQGVDISASSGNLRGSQRRR